MIYKIRVLFRTSLFLFMVLIIGAGSLPAEEMPARDQKISSIIDKVIAAYGGKDVIEGIHSIHAKGKIEAFMLHDRGTYEYYFRRGRKLRVETKYERSSEIRILNGDRGYRTTETQPVEEVSGPRYLSIVYQYKHLDLLHDLITGAYQVRSAGAPSANGNVEVFRLVDKDGAVMDIFIDTHRLLILKVTAYFTADNRQTELSSEFSDFKKVGDAVFPFRITAYAAGMKVAQTIIDSYTLNPEISDSLFMPSVVHSM